jgi:hypothetical protein
MVKIIKLVDSPLKTKRFRVYLDNSRHFDFGLKNGDTYIDHHNTDKRFNYQKRHFNSKKEQPYIQNLVPSPALFSYYLLWGKSTSIKANIIYLNKLLKNV